MALMDYRQIRQIKEKHKDSILLMRIGDFYEAFGDDAITISKDLELTLTGRAFAGMEDRVPMAGFPFHASEAYIKKLVDKGHKIAVAENLTELTAQVVSETPEPEETFEYNDKRYPLTDTGFSDLTGDFSRMLAAKLVDDKYVSADKRYKSTVYDDGGYYDVSNIGSLYFAKQSALDYIRSRPMYGSHEYIRINEYENDGGDDVVHKDLPFDFLRGSRGDTQDIADIVINRVGKLVEDMRSADAFLYGDRRSNSRYMAAAQFAEDALLDVQKYYFGLDNPERFGAAKTTVAELMHNLLNVINGTIVRPSERLSEAAPEPESDEEREYKEFEKGLEALSRYEAYEEIKADFVYGAITKEEYSQEKQALKEKFAAEDAAKNGMTIKSQVDGWPDWSTNTLPDGVRKDAEWLIQYGYANESDVKSVFYDRQTSHMSDDFNAEKKDNAAIQRVAEKYREQENTKKNNNAEEGKSMSNVENLMDDPLFGDNAEGQENNAAENTGGEMENRQRMTPEDYIRQADADYIAAMREGRYPEIIDGIADFNYSVRNVMLIKSQMPTATKVMGLHAWNYQNRSVIGGEKSLKILAVTNAAENESDAESGENTGSGKNYRMSYVFDISQTSGKELKPKACTPEVMDKYYEGVHKTIANMAKGYTFNEGERGGIDFEKKTVTIPQGLSREDELKAMIYAAARIRVEGKQRESGEEISQGRGLFNAIEASAVAHITSRRLGLGDYPLKTAEFKDFDDDALMKLTTNLHYVKMGSQRITNAVERYVSEAQSADAVRAARAATAAMPNPVGQQPVFTQKSVAEAGG